VTENEKRHLARRIADVSNVFDFETALELVERQPDAAEELIRVREEGAKRRERLDRACERLRRAALEFR
jgi:hypothetical protein